MSLSLTRLSSLPGQGEPRDLVILFFGVMGE